MLTRLQTSKRLTKGQLTNHVKGRIVVPFAHVPGCPSVPPANLGNEEVDKILNAVFLGSQRAGRKAVAK